MPRNFVPVKNGSVRARIVDQIVGAIYSGKLRPGDPLLEMQLAAEFQVSQTPIREALFQLEQLGMVRRTPNKSTCVTQLSPKEVKERLELRKHLEELAAVEAVPHINPELSMELYRLVEAIAGATLNNDYKTLARTDLDFHRAVWRATQNDTLYQVLDQLAAPLFAFTSIVRSNRLDDLKRVVHSHQSIVAALVDGKEETVRLAIREHFVDSYELLIHPEASPGLDTVNGVDPTRALVRPGASAE